jgi:hypothetical protein
LPVLMSAGGDQAAHDIKLAVIADADDRPAPLFRNRPIAARLARA